MAVVCVAGVAWVLALAGLLAWPASELAGGPAGDWRAISG